MKGRFVDSLKVGAWVTATVIILNYLATFVGIQIAQLFSVQGVTGISGTIGAKIISFINGLGILTLDISVVYLYLSAVAIIFVGSYAHEYVGEKIIRPSKEWQKLALILLWGTALFYFIIVGFVAKAWSVYIGLIVYYAVVALTLPLIQGIVRKFNL